MTILTMYFTAVLSLPLALAASSARETNHSPKMTESSEMEYLLNVDPYTTQTVAQCIIDIDDQSGVLRDQILGTYLYRGMDISVAIGFAARDIKHHSVSVEAKFCKGLKFHAVACLLVTSNPVSLMIGVDLNKQIIVYDVEKGTLKTFPPRVTRPDLDGITLPPWDRKKIIIT